MKIIALLPLLILLLFSCSTGNHPSPEQKNDPENADDSVPDKTELNGTWVMTNYLDSILLNKSVAKFRLLPASWSGIILEIRNDTLFAFGSILDGKYLIHKENPDSLCTIKGVSGSYNLNLNKESGQLELRFKNSSFDISDPNVYVYRKDNELNHLTKSDSHLPHKTSLNFTRYFNKRLIAGKYQMETGGSVEFTPESLVFNLRKFYSYEVRNYFGTHHPFAEMDVLILKTKDNETEFWDWRFEGKEKLKNEKLILTKLNFDLTTDKYNRSKEKITLLKKYN